jgi:hypothetical protein
MRLLINLSVAIELRPAAATGPIDDEAEGYARDTENDPTQHTTARPRISLANAIACPATPANFCSQSSVARLRLRWRHPIRTSLCRNHRSYGDGRRKPSGIKPNTLRRCVNDSFDAVRISARRVARHHGILEVPSANECSIRNQAPSTDYRAFTPETHPSRSFLLV